MLDDELSAVQANGCPPPMHTYPDYPALFRTSAAACCPLRLHTHLAYSAPLCTSMRLLALLARLHTFPRSSPSEETRSWWHRPTLTLTLTAAPLHPLDDDDVFPPSRLFFSSNITF